MRRAFFDFVDQIRTADKYFDVSRDEIRRLLLTNGRCNLTSEVDIVDGDGKPATAGLQLNINAVAEWPINWTMSLKLHEKRIDGFDYEAKFHTRTGDIAHGWHRHMWDTDEESAERHKIAITDFEGISTRDEFLIRGLGLLKIRLNAVDHGQDLLFT